MVPGCLLRRDWARTAQLPPRSTNAIGPRGVSTVSGSSTSTCVKRPRRRARSLGGRLQEMTQAQVVGYVEHAHALECSFLYSLNRERSTYNPEIESVSEIVSRFYLPREIAVLPVSYLKMLGDKPSALDYKHIVGRRRGDDKKR